MTDPVKCAHPACTCLVPKNAPHGKHCSEHCKEAAEMSELACECQCQNSTCR
jgi:hypothetical protein